MKLKKNDQLPSVLIEQAIINLAGIQAPGAGILMHRLIGNKRTAQDIEKDADGIKKAEQFIEDGKKKTYFEKLFHDFQISQSLTPDQNIERIKRLETSLKETAKEKLKSMSLEHAQTIQKGFTEGTIYAEIDLARQTGVWPDYLLSVMPMFKGEIISKSYPAKHFFKSEMNPNNGHRPSLESFFNNDISCEWAATKFEFGPIGSFFSNEFKGSIKILVRKGAAESQWFNKYKGQGINCFYIHTGIAYCENKFISDGEVLTIPAENFTLVKDKLQALTIKVININSNFYLQNFTCFINPMKSERAYYVQINGDKSFNKNDAAIISATYAD